MELAALSSSVANSAAPGASPLPGPSTGAMPLDRSATVGGKLALVPARRGTQPVIEVRLDGVAVAEYPSAESWSVRTTAELTPGVLPRRILLQSSPFGPDRCPRFRVLEVIGPGRVLVSEPFGNCEIFAEPEENDREWLISLAVPGGEPGQVDRWVWRDGKLEALGRELRPPRELGAVDTVGGQLRVLQAPDQMRVLYELDGRRVKETDAYNSALLQTTWPVGQRARLVVLAIAISAAYEGVVLVEIRPDGTVLPSEVIGVNTRFPDDSGIKRFKLERNRLIFEQDGGFVVTLLDKQAPVRVKVANGIVNELPKK